MKNEKKKRIFFFLVKLITKRGRDLCLSLSFENTSGTTEVYYRTEQKRNVSNVTTGLSSIIFVFY